MKFTGKITLLMMGWLCGCVHLSASKDLLTPEYLLGKDSKQITFQGDNEHPRFSPDGTKLIYASRARRPHKGSQIYEMDLLNNRERRVTYSDGDAFDPTYVSDSEILYASTTDEIKENPFLNKNFPKEAPPSELYMSDRFGSEILRLTQEPGLDAEPLFAAHPNKPFILFSSSRDEWTGVYRMDLSHLKVSELAVEEDKERRFPALSADRKQLVFVEKDLKTQEQRLMLMNMKSKKTEVLKTSEGLYRDLFFAPRAPARLFYSILRKGEKQYQIEVYNLEEKCTQVVFKGTDSLTSPAVSDDTQERIAFSRLFQDKKQIYLVNLPQDLGPCLETGPGAAPAK